MSWVLLRCVRRAAIDCPREPGLLVVMSDLAKTGYPRLTLEHTDKFLEMSRCAPVTLCTCICLGDLLCV